MLYVRSLSFSAGELVNSEVWCEVGCGRSITGMEVTISESATSADFIHYNAPNRNNFDEILYSTRESLFIVYLPPCLFVTVGWIHLFVLPVLKKIQSLTG